MHLLLIVSCLFLSISPEILAQKNSSFLQDNYQQMPKEMEVGEELIYKVTYSFIELGEIKFKVLEKKEKNGHVFYRTMAFINSYPGIPFVSIHDIYEGYFNSNCYSNYFQATHIKEDVTKFTKYKFDYNDSTISIKKGKLNPYILEVDSTRDITHKLHDGLSLFYYARLKAGIDTSKLLEGFISEKVENIILSFYSKPEPIKIPAINYELECIRIDGYADFKGIYGMTGEFVSWFTNDRYSVPIYAKLNIFIGEISIELISWQKPKWIPPRYQN